MDTFMIVGGSGFIGGHVARYAAEQGARVVLYDRQGPTGPIEYLLSTFGDSIEFVRGDLLDLPTLLETVRHHGIRRIFNAAAILDVQYSLHHPFTTYQTNFGGQLNLLEVARLESIERLVFSSSIAVYPNKQYEPLDEEHPISSSTSGHPGGHYAASKAMAEIVNNAYWQWNGVDVVSLRYAGVYGLGMNWPMYVKPLVEGVVRGEHVQYPTDGAVQREYTYVDDVAQGVYLAATVDGSRLVHRSFLVTSGDPALHSGPDIAAVLRGLVPEAEIAFSSEHSRFDSQDAERRGRTSIEAATKELGYHPRYQLDAGLREYVGHYRAYLDGARETERLGQ